MCYSSSKDFGRSYKNESDRTPKARPETKPEDRSELRTQRRGWLFWAFPGRREERRVQEPVVDRTSEKV